MEVEYVNEFPHNYMDRRPRKRPRLAAAAGDIPPQLQPHTHTKAQSGLYYGPVLGNGTGIGSSSVLPDHASLFVKGLAMLEVDVLQLLGKYDRNGSREKHCFRHMRTSSS